MELKQRLVFKSSLIAIEVANVVRPPCKCIHQMSRKYTCSGLTHHRRSDLCLYSARKLFGYTRFISQKIIEISEYSSIKAQMWLCSKRLSTQTESVLPIDVKSILQMPADCIGSVKSRHLGNADKKLPNRRKSYISWTTNDISFPSACHVVLEFGDSAAIFVTQAMTRVVPPVSCASFQYLPIRS